MAKIYNSHANLVIDDQALAELMGNLALLELGVEEAAREALEAAGEFLKTESQARCPEDEGGLAQAHEVAATADEAVVYIERLPSQNGKKPPHDYAVFVHENVWPAGPKGLGKKSQAKQAGSPVVIGGGFMSRALFENQQKIQEILATRFREALSRGNK